MTIQETINNATGNYGFTGMPKYNFTQPTNNPINNVIGTGVNAVKNFFSSPLPGQSSQQNQPANYSILNGMSYSGPSLLSGFPNYISPSGNIIKPQQAQVQAPIKTKNTPKIENIPQVTLSGNDLKLLKDTINNNQVNTGSLMNGGLKENVSATVNPDGTVSNTPIDQKYSLGNFNESINSGALGSGNSFADVLNRRQQYENQYLQAYQNYAGAYGAQQTGNINDLIREQNALYSGDTIDFGLGLQNFVKNQDVLKQAARQIPVQTALLAAQGAQTAAGLSLQDINTRLSLVPGLQSVQQLPDGSIAGVIRDPQTGLSVLQNFGNPLTGSFNTGSSNINQNVQISLPQNPDGTYQTQSGGAVNQYYAQQISSLPVQYQSYVLPGPEGTAYIDESRISSLPTGVKYDLQRRAASAGIPYLDQAQATGLQSVYSLYDTLDLMQNLVNKTLQSGAGGKIVDIAKSKIQDIFGVYPQLQNFNNLRTLAGQADTNLMGGIGSGFRQNTANLGLSVQNLPTSKDNLEEANVKIQATRALLDQSMLKTFPGFKGSGSLTSSGSQIQSNQNSNYSGRTINVNGMTIPTDF